MASKPEQPKANGNEEECPERIHRYQISSIPQVPARVSAFPKSQ